MTLVKFHPNILLLGLHKENDIVLGDAGHVWRGHLHRGRILHIHIRQGIAERKSYICIIHYIVLTVILSPAFIPLDILCIFNGKE